MGIGVLPGVMTPEFGDAVMVIDGVALALFVLMIYAAKIAAGSSRVFKLLGLPLLISRIKLWHLTHKLH
jgi:hypothetical protein